jgi:hypothetical protein
VCRHRKTTRADDPDRCACRSIRVETLDDAVWSQIRTALTTPPPPLAEGGRRRPDSGHVGGKGSSGSRLDIGAHTLVPRIADAAEDVSRLQHAIATEYQAARAAGFGATTARLMVHPRQAKLASAQQALTRLQGIREALARAGDATLADRETLQRPVPGSTSSTWMANSRSSTYSTCRHRSPATTTARPAPEPGTNPSHPTTTGTGHPPAPPATDSASYPRSPPTSATPSCCRPTGRHRPPRSLQDRPRRPQCDSGRLHAPRFHGPCGDGTLDPTAAAALVSSVHGGGDLSVHDGQHAHTSRSQPDPRPPLRVDQSVPDRRHQIVCRHGQTRRDRVQQEHQLIHARELTISAG